MKEKIKIISNNQFSLIAWIFIILSAMSFLVTDIYGNNLQNINVKKNILKPCTKKPNCVSSQSRNPKHKIQPIQYSGSIKDAKDQLKKVINSIGDVIFVTVTKKYWQIEFTSRWLGFVDDVEILFNESDSQIDIRSSSRVGYWDLGVNRKRVEKIRLQFSKLENEERN